MQLYASYINGITISSMLCTRNAAPKQTLAHNIGNLCTVSYHFTNNTDRAFAWSI